MKLRDARKEQGYTQREFAKLLDIGAPYLSCIESGRYKLSPKVRRKSAMILGLDPKVLE